MFEGLNEQQQKAVVVCDKNLLIIAGAGSGKTKTLTHKIAYILKNNLAKPFEILALTFTNKAADEMKERLCSTLGLSVDGLYIGTFHSVSLRILRQIGKRYTIYDKHDQEALIKEVITSLNLDKSKFSPSKISSYISKLKNTGNLEFPVKELEKIYNLYEEKLSSNNALDFDNILINLIQELKNNRELLNKLQIQFKYIFIDEYQDTNNLQYELIKLLYNGKNKVFAVGDEDQSIYAFRGANINNILSFSNDFLPCEIVKLEKNYRSTKNILDIANTIIVNNKMRIGKNLYSDKNGVEPVIKEFKTNRDEAYFVANEIKHLLTNNPNYSIAVLYRNNILSRTVEEYLVQYGIAYKKIGSHKFFEKKEIKDLISFIKLAYNEKDDLAFVRAISNFGGIGEKTIANIRELANNLNISLYEAADLYTKKKSTKVSNFVEFIKTLQNVMVFDNISSAFKFVFDAVFAKKGFYRENVRELNIQELIQFSKAMDVETFLENISLDEGYESKVDESVNVKLLTIHAAKGLEFDCVFVIGINEGILPSLFYDSVLEEERRIMYVAITRAKRYLYLSCHLSDFYNSYKKSRFLNEIRSMGEIFEKKFKIGDLINHKIFGDGVILNVKEEPLELKVNFFKYGIKDLKKPEIM